jgi:hypothetical protein
MRVSFVITMILLATLHSASAYERFHAPNELLEALTTAKEPDGTGMKLFVRHRHSPAPAILLLQNNRWIDAKWSPDSRFLAVIDHLDGHIADVYVFGITAANPARPPIATLFYHTPELRTYDVQWDVVGWLLNTRSIILKKTVHFGFRQETIVAHIGITALSARGCRGTICPTSIGGAYCYVVCPSKLLAGQTCLAERIGQP